MILEFNLHYTVSPPSFAAGENTVSGIRKRSADPNVVILSPGGPPGYTILKA